MKKEKLLDDITIKKPPKTQLCLLNLGSSKCKVRLIYKHMEKTNLDYLRTC